MRNTTLLLTLALAMASGSLVAQESHKRSNPINDLDTDGDGSISFAEFQALDTDRFASVDSDDDGALSIDEFLAAGPSREDRPEHGKRSERPEIDEERAAEVEARMIERKTEHFTEMDHNGDGFVTELEMQEANFLKLDSNNDGMLAGRELRRMARGPQGGPGGSRSQAGRHSPRKGQSAGN